ACAKFNFAHNTGKFLLVDQGGKPSVDVAVGCTEGRLKDVLIQWQQTHSNRNISQSDFLADQICSGQQKIVQVLERVFQFVLGRFEGLLLVAETGCGQNPGEDGGKNVIVSKGDPLEDLSLCQFVLASELCV